MPLLVTAASLRADSAVIALARSSYMFREEAGTGAVTLRCGNDSETLPKAYTLSSGLASETIIVTNPTGESAQLSNAFHYRWPDPGCGGRHRGAGH